MTEAKRPRGRPLTYTDEYATAILARLARGETLRSICRDEDMPPESTVRLWALDDHEGFAARYMRARELGAYAMADELLEVSDEAKNDWMEREGKNGETHLTLNSEHVQRSRLRVDTRKWLLSKILPRVFGDKLDVTSGGEKVTSYVMRAPAEAESGDAWVAQNRPK